MSGVLSEIGLLSLLVMAYGVRGAWACGGLVVPLMSAESNGPELRPIDTCSALKKVSIALDQRHLERRMPVCLGPPAGHGVTFILPPEQVGGAVYVFADGDWLPAWFTTSDARSH